MDFLAKARDLDAADPLRSFREEFFFEPGGPCYLDGNSLGRMPKRAARILEEAATSWSDRLIRGWNEGWMEANGLIAGKISRIIGADEDEVLLADSTSINLYKLVWASLALKEPGAGIVTDALNFPSDLYVLQGIAKEHSRPLHIAPTRDGISNELSDIAEALPGSGLLALTHTSFKSSAVHDMAKLTAEAHCHGAFALWDLSHSVGAVPVDLHAADADLAVGCSYKYLNGGPGAPAFLYVRREIQELLTPPIWGWLGHEEPFAFDTRFRPAPGIQKFAVSTPPVLSMLPLEAGVDLILEAGMAAIRAKSVALSEFFIELWESWLEPTGVGLASPADSQSRGSHVSLSHPQALAIDLALIHAKDVIPDFRAPNNVRFGFSPLYNSFEEVHEGAKALRELMESKLYESFEGREVLVT